MALPPLQLAAETISRQSATAGWGQGGPTTSASHRRFMIPSGLGWFPQFGWTPERQLDPIPQLNAVVHDELMELGNQFGQLQAWSPILPPEGDDTEQTAQESEGEQTMMGSKPTSETGPIEGPDMQELDDGDEGMDEGEIEATPSAPLPVLPEKATPKKDDTQH